MLNIIEPAITSETAFDCWMSFNAAFRAVMESLYITVNDESYYVVTTSDTFKNTYHMSDASTYIFKPSEDVSANIGFRYVAGEKDDGCSITLASLFADANYTFMSSNDFVASNSTPTFAIGLAAVDITGTDKYAYGFTSETTEMDQNALIYNVAADTNMKNATFFTYMNDDTAYMSIHDMSNYLIFTRLKPIDPNDDLLYVMIMKIPNHPNKAIYIISNNQTYDGTPFNTPMAKIDSDLHIADKTSDNITINKFVLNNRWYSDDLYVVNYIKDDHATIMNGTQFVPLGFNLFLRAK